MKSARWPVLLPVALIITLVAPVLRGFNFGLFLPDFWLLLLLVAVPYRAQGIKGAFWWVFLLGLLRASVSAVSPFSSWAGLGFGLVVRGFVQSQLSSLSPLVRLLVGSVAAAPLTVLDSAVLAGLTGFPLSPSVMLWRIFLAGCVWAFLGRTTPRLTWSKA
ncbi:MAG TPA: hypothetical protein DDW23_02460 [Planctomycetes bacterium]|nr:hypothetical protein [Planctomycetota bacterium]